MTAGSTSSLSSSFSAVVPRIFCSGWSSMPADTLRSRSSRVAPSALTRARIWSLAASVIVSFARALAAAELSFSTSLIVLPDSRSSVLSWPLARRTLSVANFA